MYINNKKGFTLIELLVVIAIIGILSSVVLASLNTARDKGHDASAKASMSSVRASAEVIYDNTGNSYVNVCNDGDVGDSATNDVGKLLTAAGTETGNTADCDDTASAYAAEVQLKSSGAGYFCVDSTGDALVQAASKGATATVCN